MHDFIKEEKKIQKNGLEEEIGRAVANMCHPMLCRPCLTTTTMKRNEFYYITEKLDASQCSMFNANVIAI